MAESSVLTPKGFLYLGTASAIGASLLIYDIFLTMDLEMDLVWRKPWSASKVLYLISRYYFPMIAFVNLVGFTTIVDPPEKWCYAWQIVWMATTTFSTIIPDVLILIRLDALCRTNQRIRFTTVVVFLVHVLALFCILIIDNVIGPGSREALAQVVPVGCNLYMYNRKSKAQDILLFIPVLAQFYYFTVTVVQFMKGAREVRSDPSFHLNSVFEINEMLPTFFLLLRQGAGYFVGTIFSYACILVLDFLSDPAQCLWLPAVMLWMTLIPLLGARFYLSMMSLGLPRNNGNTVRLAAMRFASVSFPSESF